MTEPKIEVELKDQSQPEDQSETVEQTYNYTINGKSKTVKRKYEVKDKTSFRTKKSEKKKRTSPAKVDKNNVREIAFLISALTSLKFPSAFALEILGREAVATP